MKYKIYDKQIKLDDNFENFNILFIRFSKISFKISGAFENEYKKFDSLDRFLSESDSLMYKLLTFPVKYSVDILAQQGIYDIDEQTFSDNYIDYIASPWNDAFQNLYESNNEIDLNSSIDNEYRKLRKASRGKFIGGGFGFKGATKGIATASILNAGTGLLHSGANTIGKTIDSIKNTNKKNNILKAPETLNYLS